MNEQKKNQGEGNKAADRRYREATRDFIEKDDPKKRGREAAEALDDGSRKELEEAEAEGRRRAKGFDPEVKRDR
jgi:hypothetical protein